MHEDIKFMHWRVGKLVWWIIKHENLWWNRGNNSFIVSFITFESNVFPYCPNRINGVNESSGYHHMAMREPIVENIVQAIR